MNTDSRKSIRKCSKKNFKKNFKIAKLIIPKISQIKYSVTNLGCWISNKVMFQHREHTFTISLDVKFNKNEKLDLKSQSNWLGYEFRSCYFQLTNQQSCLTKRNIKKLRKRWKQLFCFVELRSIKHPLEEILWCVFNYLPPFSVFFEKDEKFKRNIKPIWSLREGEFNEDWFNPRGTSLL